MVLTHPFYCPVRVFEGHAYTEAVTHILNGEDWAIVTSEGWIRRGAVDALAKTCGKPKVIVSDVPPNPTFSSVVSRAPALVGVNKVVCLGGGSVIDAAKAMVNVSVGLAEVAYCHLEYPNGTNCHLHLSWLDPQKRRETVLVGDGKMLIYDEVNSDRHIQIYDKGVVKEFQEQPHSFSDFSSRIRAGDLVVPNIRLKEPLATEIAAFEAAIRTDTAPIADGANGLEVTAVLEAMDQLPDLRHWRLVVDTPDDYRLAEEVYNRLGARSEDFRLRELIELFSADPALLDLNADSVQTRYENAPEGA